MCICVCVCVDQPSSISAASADVCVCDVYVCCVCWQVKVIVGEEREYVGELLSIDGQEGVVKLDKGISLLQLTSLCRVPSNQ